MASSSTLDGQKHFKVGIEPIPVSRKRMGQGMILLASAILVAVVLIQILYKTGTITVGLTTGALFFMHIITLQRWLWNL